MTAKQLTDSILQMAIQGKLVPQDPNDEPASVLLERIREQKRRLVAEGKLKKKDLEETTIDDEEIPYDVPQGWTWVRMESLCSVKGGKRIPVGETFASSPTNHIYIRVTDMKNHSLSNKSLKYISDALYERLKQYTISKDDLYLTIAGTIGDVGIVPEDFDGMNLTENAVKLCYIHVYKMYLLYAILSPFVQAQFIDKTKQMAQPKLAIERIKSTLIPLPPLAEQHRIVERIEEYLPVIKEYGEAYDEASKMDAELPDKLKKSILQEAIMGKLGTQDPNDEPASVLMEQIREEKKRLVKEGVLKKKDLDETPVDEEEEPFKVPESWGLVRLGEVTFNHGQKTPTEDFSYIDIGSIDNKHQKLNDSENILKAKDAPSRARKIVKLGDVLYATVRPYLHNMCIIDREFEKDPIASTGFAVMACVPGLYNKYLFYYLLSPIFDDYANDGDNAKGMAYPAINDKKLYNGVVPLPPLAEQHRIVQRIEELYAEIDYMTINNLTNETEIEETEE